jgi:hypothetical protein
MITRKGKCEMSNANMATEKKSRGVGCLRWLVFVLVLALLKTQLLYNHCCNALQRVGWNRQSQSIYIIQTAIVIQPACGGIKDLP